MLIFHAAESADLSQALLSSWVWAISIGSGALGLLLSLRYRTPVVIAWSIPGSALLVGALPELGLNQAIGAYLVANLILLLIALSGSFDRLIVKLPGSIAAGLQAGILQDLSKNASIEAGYRYLRTNVSTDMGEHGGPRLGSLDLHSSCQAYIGANYKF